MPRLWLLILAVLAITPAAAAQNIEVWEYPREARRDPVVPPAELYDIGTRATPEISMILFDARRPEESYAVMWLRGEDLVRAAVRAGDRLGEFEVMEIEPDRVWLCVTVLSERRCDPVATQRARPSRRAEHR